MALRRYECPNCGSGLQVSEDGRMGVCPACEGVFPIEEDVIRHRVEATIAVDGLTSRDQLHKRAEQFMEQGEYARAAELYHEIIDRYDAHDSDAWWGLTRVSVDDFQNGGRQITREQLGRNYLNALEYATPEKRERYETTIREHEALYARIVAEREAKESLLLKQQEEEAARRRVEAKKAEAEARLRESERQEAEREARRKAQARRHLHRKRAGIALVVLLTLAMCIAGYICFFAVPEARYESAVRLVEQADYGEAKEVFERLGDYKDSRYRAQECAALDALLQDDVDDVVALINGQIEAGEEESVERVRNVVQDVVRDWRAQGLSPFAVLRCLQASEVLDPMSELDVQALFQSAHVELAGGDSLLQWRVGDVNGDGEDELITLDAEMAVRVYHMAALENQEIATDVALKADLLLSFGDAVANEDGKQALSCYRRALELQDTPETREKVAAICSVLASTSAKEGDFDDALASAQTAVDMVDSAFSRCTSLCSVALPDSVLEIDTYAFNGCNQLIMTVVEGSYAHQYAIEQGIFYRYADAGE